MVANQRGTHEASKEAKLAFERRQLTYSQMAGRLRQSMKVKGVDTNGLHANALRKVVSSMSQLRYVDPAEEHFWNSSAPDFYPAGPPRDHYALPGSTPMQWSRPDYGSRPGYGSRPDDGTGAVDVDKSRKPPTKKAWCLEQSIWNPRVAWSDAKDFYDTETVEREKFDLCWHRALMEQGIGNVIVKADDDGEADYDLNGIPDEVEEVGRVLWDHHILLFCVFDYYACLGTDMSSISLNSWVKAPRTSPNPDPESTPLHTTSHLEARLFELRS